MSAFPQSQFHFLRRLRAHNDRAWFQLHKDEYQVSYAEFQEVVLELAARASQFDARVFAQPDYYKVFRVYRDVRFSTDKTPYKEHFSCEIVPGGKATGRGMYYFRLKPDGHSLVGAGWFPRDTRDLFAMRTYLSRHLGEWTEVLDVPDLSGHFSLTDPLGKLKTAPRGFSKDDPALAYLRHKSWTLTTELADEELVVGDVVDIVSGHWRRVQVFLQFFQVAQAEIDRHGSLYGRS